MHNVALTELQTFAAGLVALALGSALCRRLRIMERLDIPMPVIGGLLIALGIAALRRFAHLEILFASRISEFLLLMFFTAVGLSAKLSALKAGGKPLVILCAVTVVMIVAQNLVGVLVALAYGAHPFYGLLVGSISFVGGPGTAAAWAKQAQAVGLAAAPEVAVAGATLAVISGALVAGPLTGWLVKRHHLHGSRSASGAPWLEESPAAQPAAQPIDEAMRTLLLMIVAILAGEMLNAWASAAGWVLPGFLTAMLAGVLITNLADASGATPRLRPNRAQRRDGVAGVPGDVSDEPQAVDHRGRHRPARDQRRPSSRRSRRSSRFSCSSVCSDATTTRR